MLIAYVGQTVFGYLASIQTRKPEMTPREQAISFYNKATEVSKTEPQMSYKMLCASVEADPTMSQGWYALGNADAEMKLGAAGVACQRRAVEENPEDGKAWANLGFFLHHEGKQEEAIDACKRAISIDENLANAWMTTSLAQSIQEKTDESLKSALHATSLDMNVTTEMALGFAYLYAGDFAKGLHHFEAKLPYKLTQYLAFPWPQWKGEDIPGQTLYCVADQGLGDTLSFLRFVPAAAARCGTMLLMIQPELMRLAAMMLERVPNIELLPLNGPLPIADVWVAITSLPVALELTTEEIEFASGLPIPLERPLTDAVWKAAHRKLHIGICWAGSTGNEGDKWRSMTIEPFLELYRVPGIQLYSLQVGGRANDVHNTGSAALVKDMSGYIRDVADAAVIVKQMDLIVTVETFLGHLAGALDVETLTLYARNAGDWRHGRTRQRPIWYPKTKIIKQDETATWEPVIDRLIEDLTERVKNA